MNYYFSSDHHFGHKNIIKYCNRPFSSLEEMDIKLIKNWNNTVSEEDTVYYLGDFQFNNQRDYKEELKGNIVFIRGNHDKNTKIKSLVESMIIKLRQYTVMCSHVPIWDNKDISDNVNFFLNAHVHEEWKHFKINDRYTINVGVDQWEFRPVSIKKLIKYYAEIRRK
jgi:calcineurin-like phosphoesterase family protein